MYNGSYSVEKTRKINFHPIHLQFNREWQDIHRFWLNVFQDVKMPRDMKKWTVDIGVEHWIIFKMGHHFENNILCYRFWSQKYVFFCHQWAPQRADNGNGEGDQIILNHVVDNNKTEKWRRQ